MNITTKRIRPDAPDLKWRDGDGGIDLAYIGPDRFVEQGETVRLPLGWAFDGPCHYEMLGKSRHWDLFIVQAPLVDQSYRGEVHACLYAIKPFMLAHGDYIVQMKPSFALPFTVVEGELTDTERGDGGFGSTG